MQRAKPLVGVAVLLCALGVLIWGQFAQDSVKYIGAAIGIFIVDLIFERYFLFNRMAEGVEEIQRSIRDVQEYTKLSGRAFELLKLTWADRATQVDQTTFEVSPDSSVALWQDCLQKSSSWHALSSARDLWGTRSGRAISDAVQRLHTELYRIGVREPIKRVFVVEDAAGLADMAPIIRTQARLLGEDNIRWIERETLDGLRTNRGPRISELESLDFAVADQPYVLEFVLRNGLLYKSRLTERHDIVEKATELFAMSFKEGNPVSDLPPVAEAIIVNS